MCSPAFPPWCIMPWASAAPPMPSPDTASAAARVACNNFMGKSFSRSSAPIRNRYRANAGRGISLRAPLPLNSRVPLVAAAILPVAALAAVEPGEGGAQFDPHDVLGLLVAELLLRAEAQRGAVLEGERAVVHPPGEDGLGVEGVDQVDRFVIGRGAEAVGAVEHRVARLRQQSGQRQDRAELRALPLADRAPPLDAIVAGDLGPLRHRLEG